MVEMGDSNKVAMTGGMVMTDETLACVLKHLEAPRDRAAVSLVCVQWHRVDGMARKTVTIANVYSTSPAALTRRFKRLQELRLKGKPRAAEYNLVQSKWGGYAEPWLRELRGHYGDHLRTLQLRRMTVLDSDLAVLASSTYSSVLQVLQLHKCVGFTTKGLVPIARSCRALKRLSLEDSEVEDEGGEWLHALARNNTSLEELHFGVLGIGDFDIADLLMLVENCKSLACLKVGEVEMKDMVDVVNKVNHIEDFGAGSYSYEDEDSIRVRLPPLLKSLSGMWSMTDAGLRTILPVTANLRKLDLKYTLLSCEGHCMLLRHCRSLEELQTRTTLGDDGMEMLGEACRELRKLRVEDDETGSITQRGLVGLVQGCGKLVQLITYVTNINNAALAMVGKSCSELRDIRIVLARPGPTPPEFPLDDGLKLMLKGCAHLTRLAFYLRHGCLTDKGLEYIGTYGANLKWLLIGCTGKSDVGLANLALRSQRIERLEIRDCPFGEAGLAAAVAAMSSLKYLWVQGNLTMESGRSLVALARPCLNVELCPPPFGQPGLQLLAYYSLAGPRTDGPPDLRVFTSNVASELQTFPHPLASSA